MQLNSNLDDMKGTGTVSDEITLRSSTRGIQKLPCSHRQDFSQEKCGYSIACFCLIVRHLYISGDKRQRDRYPVTKESLRARF